MQGSTSAVASSSPGVIILDPPPTSQPSSQHQDYILLDSPSSVRIREGTSGRSLERRGKRHRRDPNFPFRGTPSTMHRNSVIVIEDENCDTSALPSPIYLDSEPAPAGNVSTEILSPVASPSGTGSSGAANAIVGTYDVVDADEDDIVIVSSSISRPLLNHSLPDGHPPPVLNRMQGPVLQPPFNTTNNSSHHLHIFGPMAPPPSQPTAASPPQQSRLFPSAHSIDLPAPGTPRLSSPPTSSRSDQRTPYFGPSHVDLTHFNACQPSLSSALPIVPLSHSIEDRRSGSAHSPHLPRSLGLEDVSGLDEFAAVEVNENIPSQVRDTIELLQAIENGDEDAISPVLSVPGLDAVEPSEVLAVPSSPPREHMAGNEISVDSSDRLLHRRSSHRHDSSTHLMYERNLRANHRNVPSMDARRSVRTGYRGVRYFSMNTPGNGFMSRSRAGAALDPSLTTELRRRVGTSNPIIAHNFNRGAPSPTTRHFVSQDISGPGRTAERVSDRSRSRTAIASTASVTERNENTIRNSARFPDLLHNGGVQTHPSRWAGRVPWHYPLGFQGELPDYEELVRLDDNLLRERNRADDWQIKSLPTHKASKEDEEVRCCICMCDVEEGEELRVLPCGHKYHKICIDRKLILLCKTHFSFSLFCDPRYRLSCLTQQHPCTMLFYP